MTVHLWLVNKCETNYMQQLVILLLISCSSTCFGRLYAHPQEVRLRFHCIWLSVLLWLLWCWRVGWQAVCTVWSRLRLHAVHTGQITICSENAVWPPDDGRKDARNMLRNNCLTIKSLIVASSWSHIYLLIKYARSLEHKVGFVIESWGNFKEQPFHGLRVITRQQMDRLSWQGWYMCC